MRACSTALLAVLALGCTEARAERSPAANAPPPIVVATPMPREVPAAPPRAPLTNPRPDDPGEAPPIEGPEHLATFFASLVATEREDAITRVTHLGDSSIGMDDLPHALRTLFQERFGDAGPGFVLLQSHSPDYRNQTASLTTPRPWSDLCFIIQRCRRDGHYGLGGVSVESYGGAQSIVRPARDRLVTRAELWFARQPRGGRLTLQFGDRREEVATGADALSDGWHAMARESGTHPVRVSAGGGGMVRAYGVVLENDGPGIVWDSLSMIGAFTHRLLAHDEAHFARQLAHRDPKLVILSYGGNDLRRVVHGAVDREGLEQETAQLLARVRAGAPNAGCLVLGINDHTNSGEADVRSEHVRAVLDAQRAAAGRHRCAFWDTTAAMGGPGSFERWRRRGMAADDGKHLTPRGRRVIAARLYAALMHAR